MYQQMSRESKKEEWATTQNRRGRTGENRAWPGSYGLWVGDRTWLAGGPLRTGSPRPAEKRFWEEEAGVCRKGRDRGMDGRFSPERTGGRADAYYDYVFR